MDELCEKIVVTYFSSRRERRKKFHIVTDNWVEDSLQVSELQTEQDYEPIWFYGSFQENIYSRSYVHKIGPTTCFKSVVKELTLSELTETLFQYP